MKKNLLIKLNDIIVDIRTNYDKSIKNSIEFFSGTIIDMSEISYFREKTCPATNEECVKLFMNEKGLFLRDKAIIKKFGEYYRGREFDGLIKDSPLLISLKVLKNLSEKHNVTLLSLTTKEDSDFIAKKLGINKLFRIITSDSVEDGISKAKKTAQGNMAYIGNNILDYKAAVKNNIPFIGLDMDNKEIEKGKTIKNIEEIL